MSKTHARGEAAQQPDWNALSPTRLWRDWIVKSEAQWSETLSQLLKDERVGDSLNRQLSEMQLAHRQLSEWAQASLAAANLPSRTRSMPGAHSSCTTSGRSATACTACRC